MKFNETLPARSRYFVAVFAVLSAVLGTAIAGASSSFAVIGICGAVLALKTHQERGSKLRFPVALVVLVGSVPAVAMGIF